MSHATSAPPPVGLRERKRRDTHQRIADEAARLASQFGMAGTTVEEIAAAAHVGRSTFFRYFDTKEIAVAEGFTTPWLTLILAALEAQPPHLGPVEAVRRAFAQFEQALEDDPEAILAQARLSQASPGLQAWTLHLFARWEHALARVLVSRFSDLTEDDPRPSMVAALSMAALRTSLERWLAADGRLDFPALLGDAFTCVTVVPSPAPVTRIEAAL